MELSLSRNLPDFVPSPGFSGKKLSPPFPRQAFIQESFTVC
jgi:hypothetical protein